MIVTNDARQVLLDLRLIDQAGRMSELSDRINLVRRRWRSKRNNATLGQLSYLLNLALDAARYTNLPREQFAQAAEELTTWSTTAFRVIRAFAAECATEVRS